MSWYDDDDIKGREWISLKVGEKATFKVKEVVKDHSVSEKFQFRRKDGTTLGWALRIDTTENKSISCSSFALMSAMREAKMDVGDTVEMSHPADGKYEVRILHKGS